MLVIDILTDQILVNLEETLQKRNMSLTFLQSHTELITYFDAAIFPGDSIAYGSSVTLEETNILHYFRTQGYQLFDRAACKTREEKELVYRQAFFADHYLLSANALTLEGEVLNVDGYGNRVAAMLFGPKQVYIVIGVNKLVTSLQDAHKRIKLIAGPLDAKKLNKVTPCTYTGVCSDCQSPDRICNKYVVLTREPVDNRVHIILINESFGY